MYTEEQLIKRREAVRKYKQTDKGRAAMLKSRYNYWDGHRHKMLAHSAVRYAIKQGKLFRPSSCEKNTDNCSGRIEAHHDDYSKKLDVRWLCIHHHSKHHNVKVVA